MRRLFLPALLICCLTTACAWLPTRQPLVVVPGAPAPAALQAYLGRWYVIAHIPGAIGRGQMNARQDVRWKQGTLEILYTFRTGPQKDYKTVDVQARLIADATSPEWEVRLAGLLPIRQRLIQIAPDNSWALLESPNREMAWILARRPHMDDPTYQQLRQTMKDHGIDTDKVWRVAHTEAQMRMRGFDQPADL